MANNMDNTNNNVDSSSFLGKAARIALAAAMIIVGLAIFSLGGVGAGLGAIIGLGLIGGAMLPLISAFKSSSAPASNVDRLEAPAKGQGMVRAQEQEAWKAPEPLKPVQKPQAAEESPMPSPSITDASASKAVPAAGQSIA